MLGGLITIVGFLFSLATSVFVQNMLQGLIKLAIVFSLTLVMVDQVNEALAVAPEIPASFRWLWFYFRIDLLMAYMGPVYTISMLSKFWSRF